ncbi:Chaperone protein dnaJ [Purpureocillium takamizusanense]|uniref:Chaperone protein dnaJ n=1 Tax=Purpureocillium takamizusanense TaxID=2060973 RepID=A0A9Q8QSR6_9HYPO|nr:Chaperone protein dnaJ [Purpureocillium takamizusanense]UNI24732.1 Chaperone protein dnaJ [Purpureocillium takamizusanense]
MPSATASGASTGGDSSSARSRDHKQGNQNRTFTVEQKEAVLRIRRCGATAFYDILGLESVKTTCTDADIKKAYRKQSLLTHPDKNGHEHADEAFKMVSRAFGILGDKEKRDKYDRFGGDPDSRFQSAQAQNPFSGFARRAPSGGMGGRGGGGGGGMWDEEVSPEEMFARFFGGGGGPFGGPQFVFNFGGGPGIRVHQFGGARPRRRPREAQDGQQQQQQNGGLQNLIGLLPILFFFILPLLSSLFSGSSSGSATPRMVYDNPQAPYTHGRVTPELKVHYFVNPGDVASYSKSKLSQLDRTAENNLVRHLGNECGNERMYQRRLREDAMGWFYQDPDKMAKANAYKMPSCERLEKMGIPTR